MKIDRELLKRELARIEKELLKKDRQPFRKELARVLGIRPTEAALKAWANKYPDKWAQAVTMLASLSGYQQGVDVNVKMMDPSQMTDVALFAFIRGMQAQIQARAQGALGPVVDVESTPVPALPSTTTGDSVGTAAPLAQQEGKDEPGVA